MSEIKAMLQQSLAAQSKQEVKISQLIAHNKILDNQVAQLASSKVQRIPGNLPPQGHQPNKTINAITLRSGTHYEGPPMPNEPEVIVTKSIETETEVETSVPSPENVEDAEVTQTVTKQIERQIEIQVPLSCRLQKMKEETQFGNFMEIVKNLRVTIPFTELVIHIPSYSKVMKDVISRKRSLGKCETIALTEGCSALLQHRSPPKRKDPGSFFIPCTIGTLTIDNALCDLGASVSVMPYSVCEKLNIGILKCASITLQMADHSVKRPMGILEDVPVKVGKFFIPVDFIILERAEDSQIPIILGSPFFDTSGAIIDVKNGKLTLEVGSEKVVFCLNSALKSPMLSELCYMIDVVDVITTDTMQASLHRDPLEALMCLEFSADDAGLHKRIVDALEAAFDGKELTDAQVEEIADMLHTSYVVEETIPERKPLASHFKYAFFEDTEQYPVIVSASLSGNELTDL
ncbi:hypothetical protein vseg_013591 [Gypsophila vaccaria]